MKTELKWITPKAEEEIVEIARVSSTRSDKKTDYVKLIQYLINSKHWSPFEMANMCISITTSRAIGRQILRHRSFTFQEFSQRYGRITNFEPIEIRKQSLKNRQGSQIDFNNSNKNQFDPILGPSSLGIKASKHIESLLEKIKLTYNLLLMEGVAKECARMILPGNTQTHMYMNGTIRSWIHFLQLRDDAHAQKEAVEIAREIKTIFRKEMPIIYNAIWNHKD